MGGDGGTKAINRAYLRGAGSATTTGDMARHNSSNNNKLDPTVAAEEAVRRLTRCTLTDQPLFGTTLTSTTSTAAAAAATTTTSSNSIVACPYGRLYLREAVVEALIRRKQLVTKGDSPGVDAAALVSSSSSSTAEIRHIRGLKDLYAVQFQVNSHHRPVCPITSRELTGKGCIAYALLRDDTNNNNHYDSAASVVSQYALQQLGETELLQEYQATHKLRRGCAGANSTAVGGTVCGGKEGSKTE